MEKSSFVTALKRLLRVREASLFLVLALLCAVIQLRNSNFLTPNVINSIFKNYAYTMTMSVGMLLVLLIGGIDISVGATLALAGMSAALLQKAEILPNAVTVYLFSTGVGLVCGIIIGLVIAKGKVIPIIATLGFMYIYRGLTYFVSDSTWVGTAYMLQDFKTFAQGTTLGINNLVAQGVDGIAVAANDAEALESTLQAARDSGIVVVTLDSDAKGSQLFVNQAGVTEVGQVLVDSIYDMTGGEGQFAVLSATSTATNQNSWIAAMEQIIAGDAKYENLEWVVTVYGDDESQKSYDETESLMTNYPDLKVICCPTTVGILACAQPVQNSGSAIKVAGLGLPSEMNGYVGEGLPCPYMYLWNPIDVGACAAYAIQAFIDGATTGAVGETYTAGNGSTYEVIEKDESVGVYTPQVIVGPPFEFTADNIAEWAEVY